MTSHRCYKRALSIPEAIAELQRVKGTQLDPKVVDVFLEILDDILEKEKKLRDVKLKEKEHYTSASF